MNHPTNSDIIWNDPNLYALHAEVPLFLEWLLPDFPKDDSVPNVREYREIVGRPVYRD
jgi:hypothetical protein